MTIFTNAERDQPTPEDLVLGLDLGQSRDYTALVNAVRTETADGGNYIVDHIERWRGERYTKLVQIVKARITALNVFPPGGFRKPSIRLVIDHTGVGRPVLDMFLEADLPCEIVGVTITGGQAITRNDDGYGVPKRLLASTLQVLLQSNHLGFADALPLAATLGAELQNFRVKISAAGRDSYGAGDDWRDGNHDDLVLAAALACWFGEHGQSDQWSAIAAEGLDLGAFFSNAWT